MKQFWVDTTKMTDGELADLIHELSDELEQRCRKIEGSWLKSQMDAAALSIRSWSTQHRRNMGQL
jgi:hypothetical protein